MPRPRVMCFSVRPEEGGRSCLVPDVQGRAGSERSTMAVFDDGMGDAVVERRRVVNASSDDIENILKGLQVFELISDSDGERVN